MEGKKRFLVVWPTLRRDWIQVFYQLRPVFDFTFLPSVFPDEPNFAKEFDCRYWSEFNSVGHVLSELKPDAIIFMSIESGLSMTLNFLAQEQGIKTMLLQHGIFTNYKDYRSREKLWRKNSRAREAKSIHRSKGFSSFRFLKTSLSGIDQLKLIPIALYSLLQQKIGPYWVAKKLPLRIKKASIYLCYSPYNAKIHLETDRVGQSQIRYIGSPELIPYLEKKPESENEPYYLHIDQALAENSFGEETLSKEAMIDFYLKLNEFCLNQNSFLYIKLHPESYQSDWLPQHDNIKYLRHLDDFNSIVQGAKGCFGFFSTMIIPAIYWKPTILFRIQYSGLQEAIEKMGAAQVLDFWSFDRAEFSFVTFNNPELVKHYFIQPREVKNDSLIQFLSE